MADEAVRAAYARRAQEYTGLLGSVDQMHTVDLAHIEQWAQEIDGPVLDAGCGPGHWTEHLHRRGVRVEGVDLVPQFIESARHRFPDASFRVASLRDLDVPDGSLGGILAWYSLIHVALDELPAVLSEFARTLARRGRLLVGFFEGIAAEPFPHAVTTAYYWSTPEMIRMLGACGFHVLDVQSRRDPGSRPHAAISAELR